VASVWPYCIIETLSNEDFVIQDFNKVLFGIPVNHYCKYTSSG
jgi:hypothetical protein